MRDRRRLRFFAAAGALGFAARFCLRFLALTGVQPGLGLRRLRLRLAAAGGGGAHAPARPIIATMRESQRAAALVARRASRSGAADGSARGALRVRTQARSGDGRSAPAEAAHARAPRLALRLGGGGGDHSTASMASRHTSGMRTDGRVTPT